MAKINRVNANLEAFASAAPGTERTIFGSVSQSDDLTSQINASFLRGWGIVGPSDQPALEDFNGAMYTHGQLLAYLHQMGIAEYNGLQEYYFGSVAIYGGAVYSSLANGNIGNIPDTSVSNWVSLTTPAPIVGETKNVGATLTDVSASATFTADEIIVKKSIGGQAWGLKSFSKVINLGTTGAGGMDIGTAPVSGFVSIYAIYNPSTAASALLACNQTTSSGPVYTGANMPAGYTASALISAWGTNASSLLNVGAQVGRQICIPITTILSTTEIFTNAPANLSAIVPMATVEIGGIFQSGAVTANVNSTVGLSSTSNGYGSRSGGGTSSVGNAVTQSSYDGLKFSVPQVVYITTTVGSGALFQAAAYITSYTI